MITQEGSPFQTAGYTDNSRFRVIVGCEDLSVGDIVTIRNDDNTTMPAFDKCGDRDSWDYVRFIGPNTGLEYLDEGDVTTTLGAAYKSSTITQEQKDILLELLVEKYSDSKVSITMSFADIIADRDI